MATRLARLFSIQPGEERVTFLLFSEFFLLGVVFNFVETSVFPLFLSEFSSGTLPYLYIINGLVTALLTTAYIRLGRSVTFARQLLLNLTFLAVLITGYWVLLTLGAGRPVIFALPILFQVVITLAQTAFWTLTARLLTLRQSKRLLGLIGSGMWVAVVLTGFLIPFIVRLIGTVNLLAIAALAMVAAIGLLVSITRRYRGALETASAAPGAVAEQTGLGRLVRNPYVALMFGLTVVAWVSFFFIDNIFFNRISAQFPDPAALSSFMGLYLAGLGIFALVCNTFLVGFVINGYGVRNALFLLPVLLFAITLAFSIVGTAWGLVPLLFWLATLNRVIDLGLMFSVDQSARTVLYQPLPAALRTHVQTVDSGIVRMSAVALAGVLLLLLNQVLAVDVVSMAYVLLAILVVWLVVVFLTGRAYPRALRQALSRRRFSGVEVLADDPETVGVLREALHNPHPGPALYALTLLTERSPADVAAAMPDLLRHPAAVVRSEALRMCDGDIAVRDAVMAAARNDPDPLVRAEGLRALGRIDGDGHLLLCTNSLADAEPAVRRAALVGLLAGDEATATALGQETVRAWASSADPVVRADAAEVIDQARDPALCPILSELLADPEKPVRHAALHAAGELGCADLWPGVVEALRRDADAPAAVAALVAGGAASVPAVAEALSRPGQAVGVVERLARALGRIGGPAARQALLTQLEHPNDAARGAVITALAQTGYRAEPAGEPRVRAGLQAEVARAAWLAAAERDLAGDENTSILGAVLQAQSEQTRDRALLLAGMISDPIPVGQARDALLRRDAAGRSYALELLEVSLPSDIKGRIMPLVEGLPPVERLARLGQAAAFPPLDRVARVQAIVGDDSVDNRWLQAAAVHELGTLNCPTAAIAARLADYRAGSDPLLSEAAVRALAACGISPLPEGVAMLSTVERVIILKDVELFATIPDELLAEVAMLMTEVVLLPEQAIFEKGDRGDSLYLIVSGRVRVHDSGHLLNELGESEVFGEMALLDSEPRMASVTAIVETLLLRLDQDPFYDLMDAHSEVARGIIRTLSGRLRERGRDLAALKAAALNG